MTRDDKVLLEPGMRAMSRVFTWMTGVVVRRNGTTHVVRVDPEIGHFSETIIIQADEIVEPSVWRVDQARHDVEGCEWNLKATRERTAWARSEQEKAAKALRAARRELRDATSAASGEVS